MQQQLDNAQTSRPNVAEPDRDRIIALMRSASVEVSASDRSADVLLRDCLDPGTDVYITFAPSDTHHASVAVATRLRRAGFNPVPHMAARHLASFTQLNDFVMRAVGEAGVTQVLVVAGDVERPVGPFASSLELLETGVFEKHGIRRIAVAGYPEGHPKIGHRALEDALRAKIAHLERVGIAPLIISQFVFEAEPIEEWFRHIRALGVVAPVCVGLAGPASVATLAKFAVRCGIGNSIKTLLKRQSSIARLVMEAGPEQVVHALALAQPTLVGLAGLHFFTFGGIARTAAWRRAIVAGDFKLSPGILGFHVVK